MSVETIVHIIMGGSMLFALWYVFVHDYVADFKTQYFEKRAIKDKVSKIAKVKLVSDDRKEIEKFVGDNAEHLSHAMVNLLVARIESIKDDRVIADDDLKVRFEEINQKSTEPANNEKVALTNKAAEKN